MLNEPLSPSVDARLKALEHQVTWWRRAAIGALFVLGIGGTVAFQRVAPGPLEASSLTLRAPQGAAVTLSLRSSGDLEARFSGTADPAQRALGRGGFALVDPAGREVLRIGEFAPRQLAP